MDFLSPRTDTPTGGRTIYTLDNGMKVLIEEDHFSPVVAMQIWVGVGGADETDEDAGIAHVHEHMLFKGTSTRGVGEIASEIEAAGGRVNAWTAWDQTVYHVVLASRYADQALSVLTDAVRNSSFDPVELKKELGVVMEEYKRGLDMPNSRLFQALFANAYDRHPYQRPVIGTKESILAIDRPKVLDFFHRYYAPNNMTLVIVGDVDTAEIKDQIERELGGFAERDIARPERPTEPTQNGLRFEALQMDVEGSHFALGFHIPSATHPDTPGLDVLAQILGSGASSRLYERLAVRSQLVSDVGAFAYTPEDPGLFVVTASLEAADTEAAFEGVIDELAKLRRLPVTAEELQRARVNLEAEFVYRSQTVQGQAREIGNFLTVFDDPDYADAYIAAIRAVTPETLQKLARGYLHQDNLTVVTLTPDDHGTALSRDQVASVSSVLAEDGQSIAWAGHGEAAAKAVKKPRAAKKRPNTEPKMIVLRNGARVIVQEHHDVPLFSVRAAMMGGLLAETPETNGLSGFAATMLTRGTKTRSRESFARSVESIAGNLGGFSGRNSLGVSGGFLSENFAEGMDLFLDVLLEPAFPEDEIEKTKQETLRAIKNRADSSSTVAFDLAYATMFEDHPYGMRAIGEPESIRAITREKLQSFYRGVRNPENLVFSVVGDVDADEVVRVISERYKGKLDFSEETVSVPPSPVRTEPARAHVDIDRAQAHIVLAFPGVSVKSPDRHAVSVMETILSRQGGRLFYSLRDVQGLAYSVTAFSAEGLADGMFGAYIATDPANTGKSIRGLLAELQKIVDHPVDADEMERAKRYLIGSHAIALQTNGAIADEMLFNELYGLGFMAGRKYEGQISEVTIADVQRAAERYIRPSVGLVATVGPAEVGLVPITGAP